MNANNPDIFSNVFVQIFLIVLVTVVVQYVSDRIIGIIVRHAVRRNKHETRVDELKREDTLINVFRGVAALTIWLIAAATILGLLKFNVAAIATGAGLIGIVVGMGAQTTIRDYIAGIFILLENQYRVGDIVTLSGGTTGLGTSGVVESITLRITKLRDMEGTLNIVRNGEAAITSNRTFKQSSVVIDIGISYDSDIDTVEKVVNRIGKDMQDDEDFTDDINEPIKFLRVDSFSTSAIIIKVVGKVKPARQWDIAGEYRRRLLKAFKVEGIEIALPQVVVHQKK